MTLRSIRTNSLSQVANMTELDLITMIKTGRFPQLPITCIKEEAKKVLRA